MKIVTPPLVIDNTEGFKQDILERKGFGESLLNLIENSEDELVISLDGRWGEGKTTFVKMWQGLLSEKDIPNIYIDSFANDYIEDAFISIAGSITSYAEDNIKKSKDKKIKEFKSTAKNVGVQLLSWTAKIGLKAVTLGAVKDSDIEGLKEIKYDIAKDVSSVAGDFVCERLSSHAKDIQLLELFKKSLSELSVNLSSESNKPLVIIIDELDRCKPTYAVEIIEKIKHLFSVKNVVFVLVMHKEQLEEAVKSVYGVNIDARTYLQKFINIETILPKRIGETHTNDVKTYSQKLYDAHELETWGDRQHLIDSIGLLAEHFNLSLRQLERVYTIISLFYAASAENKIRLTPLVSFLAVIKVVHPTLFIDLLHNRATYEEVCSITGLTGEGTETPNNRKSLFLMSWVKFSLITDDEFKQLDANDRILNFNQSLSGYDIGRERLMPYFIQKLSMFTAV